MKAKYIDAPIRFIRMPITIGPPIAPSPLTKISPPDAAAMSVCSRKSLV